MIVADVEARYGQFHLLIFNERPWQHRYGKPAAVVWANGVEHAMYTIRGELSEDHGQLLQSGALSRLLDLLHPQEFEQVDISQQLVRMCLRHPTKERVFSVLDAVVDQMPHESQRRLSSDSNALPVSLRPLVPLLVKWAIDDDEERTRKLQRSTISTLQKLINAVIPRLRDIDAFLASFGANPPTEACAFESLAQAALEPQLVQATGKK